MTDLIEAVEAIRANPDDYKEFEEDYNFGWVDACNAVLELLHARASLAQPEPEPVRPTDEELLELMPQQFRDDLATVSCLAAHGTSPDVTPGISRVSLNTGALDYARAALARWGTPTNNTSQEEYE